MVYYLRGKEPFMINLESFWAKLDEKLKEIPSFRVPTKKVFHNDYRDYIRNYYFKLIPFKIGFTFTHRKIMQREKNEQLSKFQIKFLGKREGKRNFKDVLDTYFADASNLKEFKTQINEYRIQNLNIKLANKALHIGIKDISKLKIEGSLDDFLINWGYNIIATLSPSFFLKLSKKILAYSKIPEDSIKVDDGDENDEDEEDNDDKDSDEEEDEENQDSYLEDGQKKGRLTIQQLYDRLEKGYYDNILRVKIAWHENGWQGWDIASYNNAKNIGFDFVKKVNFAAEWWTFFEGLDKENFYSYAHQAPQKLGTHNLIIFVSKRDPKHNLQLVGFYSDFELLQEPNVKRINLIEQQLVPEKCLSILRTNLISYYRELGKENPEILSNQSLSSVELRFKVNKKNAGFFPNYNEIYVDIRQFRQGTNQFAYISTPKDLNYLKEKIKYYIQQLELREQENLPQIEEDYSVDWKTNISSFSGLYFPKNELNILIQRICTALDSGKHIILIGHPGSGKSKVAKELCNFYRKSERQFIFTTANSDWSTYDTIGAYRLNSDKDLDFSNGVFLDCFKEEDGSNANKWLIIDELNRADIDKAFGTFFSVLAKDKVQLHFKDKDGKPIQLITEPTTIPDGDNVYKIPADWRIIATMNTRDKASLYSLSYAFLRRFAIIPVPVPTQNFEEEIKNYVKIWNKKEISYDENDPILGKVASIWQTINNTSQKIGPAIILDILKYMEKIRKAGNPIRIQDLLILYILPQLEGLERSNLIDFLKEIRRLFDNPSGNDFQEFCDVCEDYLGEKELGIELVGVKNPNQ